MHTRSLCALFGNELHYLLSHVVPSKRPFCRRVQTGRETVPGIVQMRSIVDGSNYSAHSAFPYPPLLCLCVGGRPVATTTGPEARES